MKRVLPVLFVVLLGGGAWYWWRAEKEEDRHAAREETEVQIGTTAADARWEMFEAGGTTEKSRVVRSADNWFGPGRYFVKAEARGRTQYYPVPLAGYRRGPDRDGAYVVTIRPAPADEPPAGFVFIPSGNFLLGDRTNPKEPHYVWLPAYYIGEFEVTNEQFRPFWMSAGLQGTSAALKAGDTEYVRFGQGDQPVTNVSWLEAVAYTRWLTERSGQGKWTFRLPSDAEWEKAARGPDGFDYGLGMTISDAEIPLYNWKKNPDAAVTVSGYKETRAGYRTNRYGLYHASGNVAEWTMSAFWPYSRQQPYADDRRNSPDLTSERRTVRGGSWYSATSAPLLLPYRDGFLPEHRGNDVGFRVVAQRNP